MGNLFQKSIMIIDDHPILRKGLVMTVESEAGFKVTAQFDNAEDALKKYDEVSPDMCIVDISLPGMNGLEFIKHLKSREPNAKILVVSRHDESLYAERVIRAGAKDYVMKLEAGEVLLKAMKRVLSGGMHVSEEVSERLLMGMAQGHKNLSHSPIDCLSDRELEVFEMTGKGNTTREIADKLHLSVKTIESYRARIKTKLNFENATELMMHAVKWVENEDSQASNE